MIKSNIKKRFTCDKNKLWNIITDNSNYKWRSDLSKIEIIDETHFVEYTKNNLPTYFTITSKIKLKEYKFDLENDNLKRKWIGIFNELPMAKSYLKNQQKRYIKDLEKELNK